MGNPGGAEAGPRRGFTPDLHLLYTYFTPALHLLYTGFTPALHLPAGQVPQRRAGRERRGAEPEGPEVLPQLRLPCRRVPGREPAQCRPGLLPQPGHRVLAARRPGTRRPEMSLSCTDLIGAGAAPIFRIAPGQV